jgi:hypothetical protein
MIIIVLFLFIASIVIALNMYDSSNLQDIETYIKNQKCENIVYAKGSYKSLCKDRLLEISNSFSVDVKEDSIMYYYKDIKELHLNENKNGLIINNKYKVDFKEEKQVYKFYDELKKRIKN